MSPKPRVVIDARMAGAQGHGIGLYVQQLAQGLSKLSLPYEPFFLVPPDCPADSALRKMPHAESKIPFLSKGELFLLKGEIRRYSPKLYHSTSFSSLLSYPCPHVQTVHDLNHLHYGTFLQGQYYSWILFRSLRKARTVLSVSKASAQELQGWLSDFSFTPKVEVAPNAILEFPEQDDAAVLKRFGLRKESYYFALSNSKPHKNLALLESAFAKALNSQSIPPLVLSISGQSPQGMMHIGALKNFEVGALLRNAKTFFFPSLYEGFGRPPVEAALAGTIPVVSSLPVHREALAGVKEAVFLDPNTEIQWIECFLRHAEATPRVSEESRAWIRETWSVERLAAKMDEVYRECLKG